MGVEAGEKAPDFELPGDAGPVRLSAFRGRPVVLYFYPKDDTSGCTAEAKAFTDKRAAFAAAGTTVIGISKDSPAKHAKFRAKYDLAPILASDEGGKMLERWGVWLEKSLYGRKYMGIDRSTFLIDNEGVVRQVWRKVKVPGHAEAVLEAVKAL
ncbi:MAG: peroxiredoxin [Caulobacteraceae bacterium]